jgi:predicted nucleic acid-binding protein
VDLILDTNSVSAALDGDPGVGVILRAASRIRVPVIVLGEYRFGLLQSTRRAEYEGWLAEFIALSGLFDITERTTIEYASNSNAPAPRFPRTTFGSPRFVANTASPSSAATVTSTA